MQVKDIFLFTGYGDEESTRNPSEYNRSLGPPSTGAMCEPRGSLAKRDVTPSVGEITPG